MPDLALDAFGDLDLSTGEFRLTDDTSGETTEQRLRVRLRLFAGEWFLDTRLGVDWYGRVVGKGRDPGDAEAAIKTAILETPGVVRLERYAQTPNPSARTLSVSFAVLDENGELVEVTEEF